jgi:hypothetical protein
MFLRNLPLLLLFPALLPAQPAQKWNMALLSDVVWSFEMTYEAVSGEIIETADAEDICDVLLAGDYSYEIFDRDQLSRGVWTVQGDVLYLPFRGASQFILTSLKPDMLELRFSDGYTTYIHRFLRQGPNPTTQVPNNPNNRTWITGERNIRIELTGGGFFGGADPVQRDFILIRENGRLIHERQTVSKGLRVTKKSLSNRQLSELADFIRTSGFFALDSQYGCATPECENRLHSQPTPIPLRLAVTDGLDRHVVEVAIWPEAGAAASPISIPPELVRIVQAIRRLSEE